MFFNQNHLSHILPKICYLLVVILMLF
uniref:Uncharacterized protein n=1 Tax=Rhizophora mucronata TaxID=61149 RepID=A0A2P2IQI8_RHIMU